MGKFDHLSKLEVIAAIRAEQSLPAQFRGSDLYYLECRLTEILELEEQSSRKSESDKWAAEMFHKNQAHKELMESAQEQLRHQKSVARFSMWISVVAALAAIASAVAAFLVRSSTP